MKSLCPYFVRVSFSTLSVWRDICYFVFIIAVNITASSENRVLNMDVRQKPYCKRVTKNNAGQQRDAVRWYGY